MISTDNETCVQLALLLPLYGVKKAVLCPGSRNFPLINAITGVESIGCISIVDEREAAFVALGMAEIGREPVVLVCTSGSAVLNFAPAVAEAYYKHIPLIVISADRMPAWIDQEDSQTIRQNDILGAITLKSYTLPVKMENDEDRWWTKRIINEACATSTGTPQGPVHINVPLSEPLFNSRDYPVDYRVTKVDVEPLKPSLTPQASVEIAKKFLDGSRILIIAGSGPPDSRLTKALEKILKLPNVYLLSENLANLHLKHFDSNPDSLLNFIGDESCRFVPDIVISFGGPFVSKVLKQWLRAHASQISLWHVSESAEMIDTFLSLTRKFRMNPTQFFTQVAAALRKIYGIKESRYAEDWTIKADELKERQKQYLISDTRWCDYTALHYLVSKLALECNVQVSNGMSVRYLMSIPRSYRFHRVDCNRGVSGIDGCTSTAIGASIVYGGTTVLISGDMSARYDIGAMIDAAALTKNFKLVILKNGGGDIFNFINAGNTELRERYLTRMIQPAWQQIAEVHGWRSFAASSLEQLAKVTPEWLEYRDEPSVLLIETEGINNSAYFRNILQLKK